MNKSTPEADAYGKILMQTFETHYLDRLKEFGCSEVVDGVERPCSQSVLDLLDIPDGMIGHTGFPWIR